MIRVLLTCLALLALASPTRAATVIACQDANGSDYPVSPQNPCSVQEAPTALTNSAAGTMGTSAAIIVPFSATRKWLMIINRTAGTETQDIGSSNVTVGGGIPLQPGGGFLFSGAGAAGPIYGITTTTGSAFSYVEG